MYPDPLTRASQTQSRWGWILVVVGLIGYVILIESSLWVARGGPQSGVVVAPAEDGARVTRVYPGTEAWNAGVRPGDRVLNLPGDGWPESGRQTLETVDPVTDEYHMVGWVPAELDRLTASLTMLSLLVLIVGVVVLLLANSTRAARSLFLLCLSGSFALMAAVPSAYQAEWAHAVEWFSLAAVAWSMPAFFEVFPEPEPDYPRRRLFLTYLLGALALGIVVAYPPVIAFAPDWYPALRLCLFALIIVSFATSVGLVIRNWRTPTDPTARAASATVAIGFGLGLAPFIFLSLVPTLAIGRYLLLPEFTIFTIALFPGSLGIALLRRHLLGIDRLLRRSLLEVAIWLAILGSATWVVTLLRPAITHDFDPSPISTAVAIFLAVTLLPWSVRRLQVLADQYLFRDVYNYADELLKLTAAVARTRSWDELRDGPLATLAELLRSRSVALMLAPPGPARPDAPAAGTSDVVRYVAPVKELAAPGPPVSVPLVGAGPEPNYLVLAGKDNGEPYLRGDVQLVETLAGSLSVTIENLRLVETLQQHIRELEEAGRRLRANQATIRRLYERLTEAQEEERRRIARDIHDEPLQQVLLLVRRIADRPASDPESLADVATLHAVAASLRAICSSLRPPVLDDLGLADALEWLIEENSRSFAGRFSFHADPDAEILAEGLSDDAATALFRVAQEALSNALKHAEATSIDVLLACQDDRLMVIVQDDGRGFDPDQAAERSRAGSLGLVGMRERLRPFAGRLNIASAPDAGTSVTVSLERERHHVGKPAGSAAG